MCSQKAPVLYFIVVGEVIYLEFPSNGAQWYTLAVHGQEVENIASAGHREQSLYHFRPVPYVPVAHASQQSVNRLQGCRAVGLEELGVLRVIKENRHPMCANSPTASGVDQ